MFPRARLTLDSLGRGFHLVSEAELDRDPSAAPSPIDFAPLFAAAEQVGRWLLDIARSRTNDPADRAAIDRLAQAIAAPSQPPRTRHATTEEDLLTVVGILLDVLEAEAGVFGLAPVVGALYDATDGDLATVKEELVEALTARVAGDLAAVLAAGARQPRPSDLPLCIPVVVRRRPRVAHGADDLPFPR